LLEIFLDLYHPNEFSRMRFSTVSVLATAFLAASSNALNLIVTNDDGFGAANVREFYRLLKAAGHNGML